MTDTIDRPATLDIDDEVFERPVVTRRPPRPPAPPGPPISMTLRYPPGPVPDVQDAPPDPVRPADPWVWPWQGKLLWGSWGHCGSRGQRGQWGRQASSGRQAQRGQPWGQQRGQQWGRQWSKQWGEQLGRQWAEQWAEQWGRQWSRQWSRQSRTRWAPPVQREPSAPSTPARPWVWQRSRVAAGMLGVFLGAFGLHRMYLGYWRRGLTMLAITVVGGFFTLGLAALVMVAWGFFEGLLYLSVRRGRFARDARGRPLRG